MLPTTYAYTRHMLDATSRGGHRAARRACTGRDQASTSDAFDRSTRYEIAFWQVAYSRGESDRA